VPAASEVEAKVTVTAPVPLPLEGETVMRLLPVPTLAAVHETGPPLAVCVTIICCAGVFGPSVVPLARTAPKFSAPRSSARPPPLGGGGVVGIVVETSFEGALLRLEVLTA
jgi:hypothetical protein